ncbi:hypothetical protein PMG11_07599 [Penicillium brasilianum]|uniref:Uncharacterized protein n=1 Tax=Penicillium brasilianum TaxID=104259 RepID=A0A0F7TUB4_PENBI|nr:hypothetical protein PMG11_07599 [Penicillium brasilianum]
MSFSYSAWFRKGPDPGTIITLDHPVPSRWKILEKLNERDYQVNEEENKEYGYRSFASAKYPCCDPRARTRKAIMRIYVQVPHRKTEMDDAGSSDTPKLLGYKIGKQDRSGLVPGGFITWLVWEIVPGVRLGDGNGADPFWAQERGERDQVRSAFQEAAPTLHEKGWFPHVCGASSLVWHRETQKLYFIGPFSMAGKPERPIVFGAKWIAHFDLAKPDPSTHIRRSGWDGDTTHWQW